MPFAKVNGKSIYYVWRQADAGPLGSSLTLLLIHGLGSSSSFYAPVIPRLVASGFSCVALDTYGSCQSEYTGQKQDVKTIANDAEGLLSSLGISTNRVIAVGHSMGGMVVGEIASRRSLAGVVLIGPVNPNPLAAEIFAKRIETVRKDGMEAMADIIPKSAMGSKATATQQAFVRALLLSQSRDGYSSLCQVIASATIAEYGRAQGPLLVIAGEEDKVAPLEESRKIWNSWNSDIGEKRLEILPGVGHWHCIEAADDVGTLIVQFARGLASKNECTSLLWTK